MPSSTAREPLSLAEPTPPRPDDSIALILDLADRLRRESIERGSRPVGLGVVVPGQVDVEAGVAVYSANLGWRDVPFARLLADHTGLPTRLGHDVTAGGIAELTYGGHELAAARNSVVLQLGTGIAGVVVSDGTLLVGAGGLAGEIGHIPVHPGGEECPCGQRGCLERYASAAPVGRRYAAAGGAPGATSADVVRLRGTDAVAARVWDEAVEALALAIATATMLLDPSLVVFSGGLSAAGEELVGPVRSALADKVVWRQAPSVVASALGPQVGLAGASITAWHAAGHEAPAEWIG